MRVKVFIILKVFMDSLFFKRKVQEHFATKFAKHHEMKAISLLVN
ncbi:hypothetical protein VC87395_000153 [Vibrio paracholerae 87395]|nr:hypothetical protein VC87395_000153 [Vibrio paracholerae 87395]